jgi:CubicO group peptidase (beta-lactamase class C family)
VLQAGIEQHAFPGASVAVTHKGKLIALKGLGRFTYDPASPLVTRDTIFDLASLTKVIATTALCMVLFERGILRLEQKLVEIIPEFKSEDPRRNDVTFRMLLAHSAGLPAYIKLFERVQTRDELIREAMQVPLAADPGTRAEYSDIGFILLGVALERLTSEALDQLCLREIFSELALKQMTFNPPDEWKPLIPPTVDDRTFRHKLVQGEVHDENAWIMGGVAAHAGCFAPAVEVAMFAESMLARGKPLVKPETVKLFTTRENSPAGTSRALGWDTPSQPSQSGKYFSARSFGHLGYTGTSLWIDPERQLSVTLLTNRTWPDNSSQLIKQVRPAFHDAIGEALK